MTVAEGSSFGFVLQQMTWCPTPPLAGHTGGWVHSQGALVVCLCEAPARVCQFEHETEGENGHPSLSRECIWCVWRPKLVRKKKNCPAPPLFGVLSMFSVLSSSPTPDGWDGDQWGKRGPPPSPADGGSGRRMSFDASDDVRGGRGGRERAREKEEEPTGRSRGQGCGWGVCVSEVWRAHQ